jgi:hypothetical protein
MTNLILIPLLLLAADESKWRLSADGDVKVYAREHAGSDVREMKAVGLIDASPLEVWKAIRDYDGYPKNMPYTSEAKVLSRSEGDQEILFYSRLETPLVSSRDYLILLKDESDWKDGAGFMKVSWSAAPKETDAQLPEKKDVVRVRLNDGYWLLEPREEGKKTLGTYYIYTSPGGSIPGFIANSANGIAVPKVFDSIRKTVLAGKSPKK